MLVEPPPALLTAGVVGSREDPYDVTTRALAQAAVVVAGLEIKLASGIFVVLPVALALLPLWARSLRRYVMARTIVVGALLAVVAGRVLANLAVDDHSVSRSLQLEASTLLLSGIAAFALVLWARTLVPRHRVVMLYGAGALAGALLEHRTSWKFDLALPVTLLVLGWLEERRGKAVPAFALAGLGVVTALDDGRSFFGLSALAAAVVLWQVATSRRPRPRRRLPVLFVAVLVGVFYLLASVLLTRGYLGSEAQERTRDQIKRSGSLIAGGRPEWAATYELFRLRPAGYGAGVIPNRADIQAGKVGLAKVKVDLDIDTGRKRYMFGGQFKLHSIVADLWVSYGWIGLALAAAIAGALLRSVNHLLSRRTAAASELLLAAIAGWFMLFGPIYSNWNEVCVAAGVVLVAVARPAGRERFSTLEEVQHRSGRVVS